MSTEYPGVLGDLVEARQRFEVNSVHYLTALDPTTISPGETAYFRVWLQSCWDVPVEVAIVVQLPTQTLPTFSVIQKRTDVPLEPAEVGEVTIPLACAAETEPAEYIVRMKVGAQLESRGLYVRSKENQGQLGDTLLNHTIGMGLAASVGLGFKARTQPERQFSIRVEGPPQSAPTPDLTPTFLSHWTVGDLAIQGKARKHVNDQRLYLLPQLTRRALYMAFLEESQDRFKDAALPLHIGEAVFLSKILTYTVEYFLKRPNGPEAILIPAYTLAYRYDLPTNDPVFLVVRADYARIVRLGISLSFGMLRHRLGRDVWSMEEQLAVADLVANRTERGGSLPAEFVYLPLLLGGLMIAGQVQMPGEDLRQSLDLFAKARQQRADKLGEIPELVALLDQLEQTTRPAA